MPGGFRRQHRVPAAAPAAFDSAPTLLLYAGGGAASWADWAASDD
jgi:hypothetical protein